MSTRLTPEEVDAYLRAAQMQEERRRADRRRQDDFKVFISYSHADRAIAQRLTALFDELEVRNYVIDEKTLEWGDCISEFARDEISKCTHYLLILSEKSSESRWCALEFGIAFGLKKETLLLLADGAVPVPEYASDVLATPDIDVVARYFSRDLIDAEAVQELIIDIIDDQKAVLEEFKAIGGREGCECWDSPDREAIEAREPESTLFEYLGGNRAPDPRRLVRIELRQPFAPDSIVLHYHSPGSSNPEPTRMSFRPELAGVVVEPRRNSTDRIGVRETTEGGGERLVKREASVMEQVYGHDVEGWEVSRSFWERTVTTLRAMLPD